MLFRSQTQDKINQVKKAGNAYMDESLRQTEEAISKALSEVRDTRMRFRAVVDPKDKDQQPRKNMDVEV